MQLGHDDFKCRYIFLFVQPDGNAAAVIHDRNAVVRVNDDLYQVAEPCHGLVDAIIDDFIDEMVQPGDIDISDVHGRTFADGFQPLEDFDVVCGVVRVSVDIHISFVFPRLKPHRHYNAQIRLVFFTFDKTGPFFVYDVQRHFFIIYHIQRIDEEPGLNMTVIFLPLNSMGISSLDSPISGLVEDTVSWLS